MRGWTHARSNRVTYNLVITAWARSGEQGSAIAAERLLEEMYDEFHNNQKMGGEVDYNNNGDLKPD